MSTFASLKANRNDSMAKLLAAAEKLNAKAYEADETYWQPTVDKAGNGFAVIRFLPAGAGEETPWVRYWDHGFKGPSGRWYIENSLTTLGQDDPVSDYNSKLWNASQDDNSAERKQAREQKRRLHYVSNILVISDPAKPENDGKVFKFKYGKKIWDKIDDIMHPQFPGEKAVNPFDFWGGADFKLKIRKFEGYRNYDKSEFDKPSELFDGNDKKLEVLYKQLYTLQDIIAPSNFKTYNELKKKLIDVLGAQAIDGPSTAEDVVPPQQQASSPGRTASPAHEPEDAEAPPLESAESEEGDSMSYFAKLAANG